MSLHLIDGTEESFMTGHDRMETYTLARLKVIEYALCALCMQSDEHKRLAGKFVRGMLKIYEDKSNNIPAEELAISLIAHKHSYKAIFGEYLPGSPVPGLEKDQ